MSQSHQGYADLHMHTQASDGKPGVLDLLSYVSRNRPQLNVIAITDHDTLDASLQARDLQHHYPFEIVPGLEVTSRDGHILALWVETLIPRDMDITDTVAAIHEAGGIAILAHPFHVFLKEYRQQILRYLTNPEGLLVTAIDGIEVHNAGISSTGCNWLAGKFARYTALAQIGGSDAHTLGAVGSGLTGFPGRTALDLRHAIINRTTHAKGQPWSITDYVSYLKYDKQRKAMISSASMNSSAIRST
jgi:predicted metal-dependent phosphoesterase TrpH